MIALERNVLSWETDCATNGQAPRGYPVRDQDNHPA